MRTRSERNSAKAHAKWLAGALVCSLASPAWAQQALTVEQLQERLEALERLVGGTPAAEDGTGGEPGLADLDQRLRILERKLELQQEEQVAKAKVTPVATVSDKGVSLKSADGNYEFRFRGLVQGDARFFFDDDRLPQNDTFGFRRLRPTIEGSLGKLLAFRLTPEFAGDSATIVDAYVDVKFDPAYTVRMGKVKGPVDLERLQSGAATMLIERGFPAELAPNRDIGVQLQGDLAQERLSYVAGVYNGTPDGRDAATTNPDDEFEYAGRVFFEPFKNDATAWSGLGFGIAGSIGDKHGSGNNFLPRYRTPGQVQFFNYRSAVVADGEHSRISPQAYFHKGPFGVLVEYIASQQEVVVGTTRAELKNTAWQAGVGYVLTGEDVSFRGVARPSSPFNPTEGGWGAFEVLGRYSELDVDDAAFPLFADPASAASKATAWTVGLNWYLSSNLKLMANYLNTRFEGGAASGADRPDEKAVFTRLQVSF